MEVLLGNNYLLPCLVCAGVLIIAAAVYIIVGIIKDKEE